MAKKKRLPMVDDARPVRRRAGRSASLHYAGASSAAPPGWEALSGMGSRHSGAQFWRPIGSLSTAAFAKWLLTAAVGVTLYVGHVHATQQTFERLHALRKENLRLHLERDRLQGELDHATGPTVIYPKAHRLGLKESLAYGPTLRVFND